MNFNNPYAMVSKVCLRLTITAVADRKLCDYRLESAIFGKGNLYGTNKGNNCIFPEAIFQTS